MPSFTYTFFYAIHIGMERAPEGLYKNFVQSIHYSGFDHHTTVKTVTFEGGHNPDTQTELCRGPFGTVGGLELIDVESVSNVHFRSPLKYFGVFETCFTKSTILAQLLLAAHWFWARRDVQRLLAFSQRSKRAEMNKCFIIKSLALLCENTPACRYEVSCKTIEVLFLLLLLL